MVFFCVFVVVVCWKLAAGSSSRINLSFKVFATAAAVASRGLCEAGCCCCILLTVEEAAGVSACSSQQQVERFKSPDR
jgi:hypothetical protein